eukprot:TRINITY_DN14495_c0_g1_i1.p1 TRINITY_DN14495_c0_g1~~TRINITY_DN14495_c0_g1_i1.p1  ORF type:complete len:772 (+),score=246.15 TRINITY_DN14495_c0_g1_i1:1276-3591(+)
MEGKLAALGLKANLIKGILKNADLLTRIQKILDIVEGNASNGQIIYQIASEVAPKHLDFVIGYLKEGKVTSKQQVSAMKDYFKKLGDNEIVVADFDKNCGIGLIITEADVKAFIDQLFEGEMEEITTKRYTFPFHKFNYNLSQGDMKFADGKLKMDTLMAKKLEILGAETEADKKAKKESLKAKKKVKGANKKADKKKTEKKTEVTKLENGFSTSRMLPSMVNSPALLKEHEKATGGLIYTRFPPEPNGFLHIGHAKSMNLNFSGAFEIAGKKGVTYFRYDDTNPEKESMRYINSQADNVDWLGWKPWKVTYSSEYFDELYAFAIKLIKKGLAYVCHQTKDEIEKCRDVARAKINNPEAPGNPNSPYRNRSIEENLKLFNDMRKGKYEEGAATLRMKIDMTHPNPCMWDPIAYRVRYVAHPHIGDKWCIYPAYDFTHCIVDSIEQIDYSLCTLEFEIRRDSYYWLLEALDLWRPHVWEFARLNLTKTVLSKRKLLKLVENGIVHDWDDPRLPTINGLRRRGYTAEAINKFCEDIGVSRKENVIQMERLEYWVRNHLNQVAMRRMAVLDPLKITITNWDDSQEFEELVAHDFPNEKERGSYRLKFNKTVYIDRSDFKMEAPDKRFKGLAAGGLVGLKYAHKIRCTEVIKAETGSIVELKAEIVDDIEEAPKGYIQWVSGPNVKNIECRLYDYLFTCLEPGCKKDWENYLNPNSMVINKNALIDASSLPPLKDFTPFQFERIGYFCVDPDCTENNLVFNKTVDLRSPKLDSLK